MPISQYEKDRIARVEARKNNKGKSKKKSVYVSPKTDRQKAQDDINQYKIDSYGKPSTSTQGTQGGSKSVRKITSPDSGDTDLVERLRKNPIKYIK